MKDGISQAPMAFRVANCTIPMRDCCGDKSPAKLPELLVDVSSGTD
jgi:hypothetical protein